MRCFRAESRKTDTCLSAGKEAYQNISICLEENAPVLITILKDPKEWFLSHGNLVCGCFVCMVLSKGFTLPALSRNNEALAKLPAQEFPSSHAIISQDTMNVLLFLGENSKRIIWRGRNAVDFNIAHFNGG